MQFQYFWLQEVEQKVSIIVEKVGHGLVELCRLLGLSFEARETEGVNVVKSATLTISFHCNLLMNTQTQTVNCRLSFLPFHVRTCLPRHSGVNSSRIVLHSHGEDTLLHIGRVESEHPHHYEVGRHT
jgi:hypothetical protein